MWEWRPRAFSRPPPPKIAIFDEDDMRKLRAAKAADYTLKCPLPLDEFLKVSKRFADTAGQFKFENAFAFISDYKASTMGPPIAPNNPYLLVFTLFEQLANCDRKYYILSYLENSVVAAKRPLKTSYLVLLKLNKILLDGFRKQQFWEIIRLLEESKVYIECRVCSVNLYMDMAKVAGKPDIDWRNISRRVASVIEKLLEDCKEMNRKGPPPPPSDYKGTINYLLQSLEMLDIDRKYDIELKEFQKIKDQQNEIDTSKMEYKKFLEWSQVELEKIVARRLKQIKKQRDIRMGSEMIGEAEKELKLQDRHRKELAEKLWRKRSARKANIPIGYGTSDSSSDGSIREDSLRSSDLESLLETDSEIVMKDDSDRSSETSELYGSTCSLSSLSTVSSSGSIRSIPRNPLMAPEKSCLQKRLRNRNVNVRRVKFSSDSSDAEYDLNGRTFKPRINIHDSSGMENVQLWVQSTEQLAISSNLQRAEKRIKDLEKKKKLRKEKEDRMKKMKEDEESDQPNDDPPPQEDPRVLTEFELLRLELLNKKKKGSKKSIESNRAVLTEMCSMSKSFPLSEGEAGQSSSNPLHQISDALGVNESVSNDVRSNPTDEAADDSDDIEEGIETNEEMELDVSRLNGRKRKNRRYLSVKEKERSERRKQFMNESSDSSISDGDYDFDTDRYEFPSTSDRIFSHDNNEHGGPSDEPNEAGEDVDNNSIISNNEPHSSDGMLSNSDKESTEFNSETETGSFISNSTPKKKVTFREPLADFRSDSDNGRKRRIKPAVNNEAENNLNRKLTSLLKDRNADLKDQKNNEVREIRKKKRIVKVRKTAKWKPKLSLKKMNGRSLRDYFRQQAVRSSAEQLLEVNKNRTDRIWRCIQNEQKNATVEFETLEMKPLKELTDQEINQIYLERWWNHRALFVKNLRQVMKNYTIKRMEYDWFETIMLQRLERRTKLQIGSKTDWCTKLEANLKLSKNIKRLPADTPERFASRCIEYEKRFGVLDRPTSMKHAIAQLKVWEKMARKRNFAKSFKRMVAMKRQNLINFRMSKARLRMKKIVKKMKNENNQLQTMKELDISEGAHYIESEDDIETQAFRKSFIFQNLRKMFIHELYTLMLLLDTQYNLSSGNLVRCVGFINQLSKQFSFLSTELKAIEVEKPKFFSFMQRAKVPQNNLIHWFMHVYRLLLSKYSLYATDVLGPSCLTQQIFVGIQRYDNGHNFIQRCVSYCQNNRPYFLCICVGGRNRIAEKDGNFEGSMILPNVASTAFDVEQAYKKMKSIERYENRRRVLTYIFRTNYRIVYRIFKQHNLWKLNRFSLSKARAEITKLELPQAAKTFLLDAAPYGFLRPRQIRRQLTMENKRNSIVPIMFRVPSPLNPEHNVSGMAAQADPAYAYEMTTNFVRQYMHPQSMNYKKSPVKNNRPFKLHLYDQAYNSTFFAETIERNIYMMVIFRGKVRKSEKHTFEFFDSILPELRCSNSLKLLSLAASTDALVPKIINNNTSF